ncbi:FAD-binding protein [Phyllobacterium sp. YR531]|uniref:electron transfer flavoprotein subunit alpha/FixB family protein n=1 Tax=Phyllobacterium sp. YR531 TaxID=1144343 RepID=UPI00026FB1D0|nr:FAD-binding protein [Phyllobacterium sp. YR531]EJN06733.1 electron transfer flavoprotein, alpha subunit [Phyllobacterium sp. YR531]
MQTLVMAEINSSELGRDQTAKAVGALSKLGEITVLVAGENVGDAAAAAAKMEGVSKVLLVDDPKYAKGLPEPLAELVSGLNGFTHIFAASTASAKSVMPRIAALLDVMIIPDVIGVVSDDTFERPIYAGNAIQTVKSNDKVKVGTIRTANFTAAGEGHAAPIETLLANADPGLSSWVSEEVSKSERPDLSSARIVVSGGRGVGSRDNFDLIEKLADKLGAAAGASRAAVDSGYAPNDWQVGQTGKVVAPQLYIAVGISGAIQHLAGMKDSKVIVAINKDEEAPIFQIADYGLVGDLFSLVPELTEKL